MNKKALLITLSIVVVAVVGIYIYDKSVNDPDETLWNLIPQNTALVYEPQSGLMGWEALHSSDWWSSFGQLAEWVETEANIQLLDSLVGDETFNNMISDGNMLVGVFPVSGSDLDLLFLLDKRGKGVNKSLNAIFEKFIGSGDYQLSERQFNGYSISELKSNKSKKIFSFSSDDDFWFGSFTPFLVEDVVRQQSENDYKSFKEQNPEAFFTTRIRNDAGNLYFNYSQFSKLLDAFLSPQSRKISNDFSQVAKSAFFDVTIKDKLLMMNGFSYPNESNQFLFPLYKKVPKTSGIQNYIPSKTAICINTLYLELADSTIKTGELAPFYQSLDSEFAVAVFEHDDQQNADKVYFLKGKNAENSVLELEKLARAKVAVSGDTLFFENFGENRIVELPFKNFPAKFSSFNFGESDYYYFTQVGQYVAMGNTLEAIKSLLLDIETESTWGRSVQKNNFMSNTIQESNVNIYLDLSRSWNLLMSMVHDDWKEYFEANSDAFRKIDLTAIQFSRTDQKVYTNVVLSQNPTKTDLFTRRRKIDPDISVSLPAAVSSKPKIVRNHKTREWEIIVQDEQNGLSLISQTGSIIWTTPLSGKVKGEIHQIDYFRNGYLQYLFALDSGIYLYDRNGKMVDGFPKIMPYKVDRFNLIDYDNSKNYRFVLADIEGKVYMYDAAGKNLEGWKPLDTGGRLAKAPEHLRVRGKDCILIIQDRGRFLMYNRRGELQKGFPVDLGPSVNKEFAVEVGANLSSTNLSFLTKEGQETTINLEGKEVKKQQLFQATRAGEFYMVPEIQNRGYVSVLKSIGEFRISDEEGKEKFREAIISATPFIYQYYRFGSNRRLYVVTDPEQEYSYLYDASGKLLNNSPINSKFEIGVIFSETNNQYKIYSTYENKVNIYIF